MKMLVLGSCALDMVIRVERLPKMQEDLNTNSLKLALGGMAFNVYQVLKHFNCDAILGSPVGSGTFANIVEDLLKEKDCQAFVKIKDEDNGVCMCLVDKSNDRTFISHHGAEYKFSSSWYEHLDFSEIKLVYVCGLEIEEDSGIEMIEFLKNKKVPLFFAPGPRLTSIQDDRLDSVLKISEYIHLNEAEILEYTKCSTYKEGAKQLYNQYKCKVVVTLGELGSYMFDGKTEFEAPGVVADVKDTIGAGDTHAGAMMCALSKRFDTTRALEFANCVASKVVEVEGASLIKEHAEEIAEKFL